MRRIRRMAPDASAKSIEYVSGFYTRHARESIEQYGEVLVP